MKKKPLPKFRSGVAVAALHRHAGPMQDRKDKRSTENKSPDWEEDVSWKEVNDEGSSRLVKQLMEEGKFLINRLEAVLKKLSEQEKFSQEERDQLVLELSVLTRKW